MQIRETITHIVGAIFVVVITVTAAAGQVQQQAPLVDAELTVRMPDGSVLQQKDVVFKLLEPNPFNAPAADLVASTDIQGEVKFKIPEGVHRILVSVKGVGYGYIGITEFIHGKTVHAEMPPLTAYGSIEGTVPLDTCDHEVKLRPDDANWNGNPISVDSDGRFRLDDIRAGVWSFTAFAGTNLCARYSSLNVAPGRTTKVGLKPVHPDPAIQALIDSFNKRQASAQTKREAVWVRGTVRDASARPVAGATVYAVAMYYGGIRMNELVSKTTTDSNGYYEVKGEGGLNNFTATVVVTAAGHPPAWGWPEFKEISWLDGAPAELPPPPTQDFVLPSKSGNAIITVVQDGKLVAGAAVGLYLENANLREMWALGLSAELRQEVDDAIYPVALTGADGTASFRDLLPGRYRVIAADDAKEGKSTFERSLPTEIG